MTEPIGAPAAFFFPQQSGIGELPTRRIFSDHFASFFKASRNIQKVIDDLKSEAKGFTKLG